MTDQKEKNALSAFLALINNLEKSDRDDFEIWYFDIESKEKLYNTFEAFLELLNRLDDSSSHDNFLGWYFEWIEQKETGRVRVFPGDFLKLIQIISGKSPGSKFIRAEFPGFFTASRLEKFKIALYLCSNYDLYLESREISAAIDFLQKAEESIDFKDDWNDALIEALNELGFSCKFLREEGD
jgi:hypothetical protein